MKTRYYKVKGILKVHTGETTYDSNGSCVNVKFTGGIEDIWPDSPFCIMGIKDLKSFIRHLCPMLF